MKRIFEHVLSTISALWVVLNLTFWLPWFTVAAVLKLILPDGLLPRTLISFSYHAAVRVNSFWMRYALGIHVHMEGDIGDHPSPIVISNHQSWLDIPIIHHVVTDHGPIVKFLIKRQIMWIPIVGWLCWLLGFPRLHRGQGENARKKDYETIKAFSARSRTDPGAVLIFAEGTRFTEEKRGAQASPYRHLLKPRLGGLRIMKEAADPDTPIIDLTLMYRGDSNFWECLHGSSPHVRVVIKQYRLGDIDNLGAWLNERWQEKEELLIQNERDSGTDGA